MTQSKALVDFLLSIVQAIVASFQANNKFSYKLIFSLGQPLMQLPDVLNNFKGAVLEIENADDAGRADLNAYIKQQFSLADKGLEAKIEAAISIVIKLSGLADDVKTLLKASMSAAVATPTLSPGLASPVVDPSVAAAAPAPAPAPAVDPAPVVDPSATPAPSVDQMNVTADQVNVQPAPAAADVAPINPAAGV